MFTKNIKRNPLDYILTDILPVEVSELFTFRHFYEYLLDKHKTLDMDIKSIIKKKNDINKNQKLFENKNVWASMPLKFKIIKGTTSFRELNILQPMAVLQLYYFIAAYQEELNYYLAQNSVYSLRYHQKSDDLYYKRRKKKTTSYFSDTANELSVRVIEQTGKFFKIRPYNSIVEFTKSDYWFDLYQKYGYFARIDYESCFDSIYTHTYKWIISKEVNDSKRFSNTNLFTTIDRILQNINALSSNGLVVGPEFSRMIAEVLLQKIDTEVFCELLNSSYIKEKDYSIFRYVDDIFIFSKSIDLRDRIIALFEKTAHKYLMQINQNKIIKEELPSVFSNWLSDLSRFSTSLSNIMFYSQEEIKNRNEDKVHCFKRQSFLMLKAVMKREFNDILTKYVSEKAKLVSYVLGTIINKISNIGVSDQYTIFRESVSESTLFELLDFIFYIYSYSPTFSNAQKLISIICYINDEVEIATSKKTVLQQIIKKFAFIFEKGNVSDIVNIILLCAQFKIEIPYDYEIKLLDQIIQNDNPIQLATFMVYAQYNKQYAKEVGLRAKNIIKDKVENIKNQEHILLCRDFWWVLVFNKSPLIDTLTLSWFDTIIQRYKMQIPNDPGIPKDTLEIFIEYLENSSNQFFDWDIEAKNMLREITYRTHERTVFRNFRYGQASYTSIE